MEKSHPSPNTNLETSPKPSLSELGYDLLHVSTPQLLLTLAAPFILMICYVVFAIFAFWLLAVLSVMALCFVTYGSTSHDLVHRTLKLPHRINDTVLTIIELLSLRSGTAYRLSHQNHHSHLLEADDIEGESAHHNFVFAIRSGPLMQIRLWLWAWRNHPRARAVLLAEATGIVCLISLAVMVTSWTLVPLIYAILVITGSWLFPLVTVYFPHDGHAAFTLSKTRLFRGPIIQMIAFDHLYHLEHHLYPSVPHHHWRRLAKRLDSYFEREGVKPFHFTSISSPTSLPADPDSARSLNHTTA